MSESADYIFIGIEGLMGDDKKAKVDQYQEWLLRHYHLEELASQDPEQAGQILKARQTEEKQLDSVPFESFEYGLEALRFDFTLIFPTKLKKSGLPDLPICGGGYGGWDNGNGLPFPPKLVSGITEQDLDFLERTFDLSSGERYTLWRNVFQRINVLFDSEEGSGLAEGVVRWFNRGLPEGVPAAPVFLASAKAYMISRDVPRSIRQIQKYKDYLDNLDREARPSFRAVDVLEKVGRAAVSSSLESGIRDQMERFQLDETLQELKTRLESHSDALSKRMLRAIEEGELQSGSEGRLRLVDMLPLLKCVIEVELEREKAIPNLWKNEVLPQDVPGNLKKTAKPKLLYQVFKEVAGLMGSQSKARELFGFWGVEMKLEAAKKAIRRADK